MKPRPPNPPPTATTSVDPKELEPPLAPSFAAPAVPPAPPAPTTTEYEVPGTTGSPYLTTTSPADPPPPCVLPPPPPPPTTSTSTKCTPEGAVQDVVPTEVKETTVGAVVFIEHVNKLVKAEWLGCAQDCPLGTTRTQSVEVVKPNPLNVTGVGV